MIACATRPQKNSWAPRSVMGFRTPTICAMSTSAAKRTRFSSMLRWARAARPAHPLISGSPSRLPASLGNPTSRVAPATAITQSTNVNATEHTRYINSGVIWWPPRKRGPYTIARPRGRRFALLGRDTELGDDRVGTRRQEVLIERLNELVAFRLLREVAASASCGAQIMPAHKLPVGLRESGVEIGQEAVADAAPFLNTGFHQLDEPRLDVGIDLPRIATCFGLLLEPARDRKRLERVIEIVPLLRVFEG